MASPKTSVIVHPPKMPLAIRRQDYLALCCGDKCAAELLNVFESWTNGYADDNDTWIYRSVRELRHDLLYGYSDSKIEDALEDLITWGWIKRRNNPKVGFDRKYQYRLRVLIVQRAIQYFYGMETVKLRNASSKTTDAIQESKKRGKKRIPAPDGAAPATNGKTPAQLESGRLWELSTVLASYWHAWAEPTKRQIEIARGTNSKGVASKVAKLFPELDAHTFRRFLVDYDKSNGDGPRISVADTIARKLDDWYALMEQTDTRTDAEIVAAFTPLQQVYAEHYQNETPRQILNTSEAVMRARLDMIGVRE